MTNRRKFLQILGVGTASAPLAAKELVDGDIASQMGLRRYGGLSTSEGISEAAEDASHGSPRDKDTNWRSGAAKYLQKFGKLPDHVDRKLRDEAREVSYLDYDIANKRSWSLAVKVQEQRQRNYERNINRYREGNAYPEAQAAFEKATGFKWPW